MMSESHNVRFMVPVNTEYHGYEPLTALVRVEERKVNHKRAYKI